MFGVGLSSISIQLHTCPLRLFSKPSSSGVPSGQRKSIASGCEMRVDSRPPKNSACPFETCLLFICRIISKNDRCILMICFPLHEEAFREAFIFLPSQTDPETLLCKGNQSKRFRRSGKDDEVRFKKVPKVPSTEDRRQKSCGILFRS